MNRAIGCFVTSANRIVKYKILIPDAQNPIVVRRVLHSSIGKKSRGAISDSSNNIIGNSINKVLVIGNNPITCFVANVNN